MLYWVLRPWRQVVNFRDRATRREYWLFLVQLYALILIAMFGLGFGLELTSPGTVDAGSDGAVNVIVGFAMLLFIVPYLSASVRRLHDHDKTGWLFLLTFIPLAGWIFYLIMMLTPGTAGANGYGPDPRDRLDSGRDMTDIFS